MWKRAKIPYFPPFLIHGTWWENGKAFHSGGGGGGFPHGFHVESTGKCGRGCFFFFSQTCREVSPAGDLLLPLAAKVGKNAIQTCGFKQSFWSLLGLWPKVTRARGHGISPRADAQNCSAVATAKYAYHCAFSRTGSTIYRKLSLPSTGVMTQGEILVFNSSRTLSAGA